MEDVDNINLHEYVRDFNLHEYVLDFGRHAGVRLVHVPVSYLRWAANQPGMDFAHIAEAELKRRGTHVPMIDISGHAIDRASLQCRRTWHEERDKDEGLHRWLCRRALAAIRHGEQTHADDEIEKYEHDGIRFVFQVGRIGRMLKTVMALRAKKKRRRDGRNNKH
jgi:hypothetical protein